MLADAAAVVVAAGRGRRMQAATAAAQSDPQLDAVRRLGLPPLKQFLPIGGRPILVRTLEAFQACTLIGQVVVVAPEELVEVVSSTLRGRFGLDKVLVTAGGTERRQSVHNGILALKPSTQVVLIHDGVRPFVSTAMLETAVLEAAKMGAVTYAARVKETTAVVDGGLITSVPPREGLWSVQTPQAFRYSLILEAHRRAAATRQSATDDAGLVRWIGHPVSVLEGPVENIKVTTPLDMRLAELILAENGGGAAERVEEKRMRVGLGYDVHQLVPGRALILGGVEIPHEVGLAGHSDADVLIHAIMDALLGAVGLGDIGKLFPNTDPRYAGASSLTLLEQVGERLREAGYTVGNLDAMLLAERPKIAPHISAMIRNIAAALQIDEGRVGIKATTSEGLGFVGRQEGMAAWATAAVEPTDQNSLDGVFCCRERQLEPSPAVRKESNNW